MANRTDIIWQQMTFDHFASLVEAKCPYFKAYSAYSAYDEMKFCEYISTPAATAGSINGNSELISAYNEIEKQMFISCWYNTRYLSDIVFKMYAKGDSGIAIGTSIADLTIALPPSKPDCNHNIVMGNVQYVPQAFLHRHPQRPLFEPAQVYAPVFLKGMQFRLDHEFRVCLCSSVCDADPTHKNISVSFPKLIRYIALKEDGIVKHIHDSKLIGIFCCLFQIEMEPVYAYWIAT